MAKTFSFDDWDYLSDEAGLIPVQEGGAGVRRQPGPTVVPIPGNAPPRQAAPRQVAPPVQAQPAPAPAPQQATPAPKLDEFDYFGEATKPVEQPKAPAAPPSPYAEKDADTWLGRRWQDIKGKQDPRYKDLPALVDTGEVPLETDAQAKLAMPGDDAYGDILKKSLGGRFKGIEKDANGYAIVNYLDEKGRPQKAYVNKPGLDWQDIDRGISGAMPFVAGGGLVGKLLGKAAAPLIVRAPVQALTAGAVSGAQDVSASGMGSEQGFDAPKAIGAMAGGVLGEVAAPAIGAVWRKLVTEPSLFNRSTGQLTEKGMEAARAAGLDPTDIPESVAREFAKRFARTGQEADAAMGAQMDDLGLRSTVGQRSKDVSQLSREQAMRDGAWGQEAADRIKAFDKGQWDDMTGLTLGTTSNGKPGMAPQLAPKRIAGEKSPDYTPNQVGIGIAERLNTAREAARATERQAWEGLGNIEATEPAIAALPDYVNKALGGFKINERTTPVASQMAQDVQSFINGKAPKQVAEFLRNDPVTNVNEFRKMIGSQMADMERGADKTAAGKIYDGVNTWIRDMAEQNLLTNPNDAAQMTIARGVSRQLHEVFDVPGSTAGAKIMKDILDKTDSPEGIVKALFQGPTSDTPKQGAVSAINAIKQASAKYLPKEEGEALMGDLRLAYWLRLVQTPEGVMFNPQVLLKNIDRSLQSQTSVWNTLYTPEQRRYARQIAEALRNGPTFKDWTIKPNSSRSATVAATMLGDMVKAIFGAVGGKTALGQTAGAAVLAPFRYGWRRAGVNAALESQGRASVPTMIGPYGAAGGAEAYRDK